MENIKINLKLSNKKIFMNIFAIIICIGLGLIFFLFLIKNDNKNFIILLISSVLLIGIGLYLFFIFITTIIYYNISKKGKIEINSDNIIIKILFKKLIVIPIEKLIHVTRNKYKIRYNIVDYISIIADVDLPAKKGEYPDIKIPVYLLEEDSIDNFILNIKSNLISKYKQEVENSKEYIKNSNLIQQFKSKDKFEKSFEKGKIFKYKDIIYEVKIGKFLIYFKDYKKVNFNLLNKMIFISKYDCLFKRDKGKITYFELPLDSICNFYSDVDFSKVIIPTQIQKIHNKLIIDIGSFGDIECYPYDCTIFVDYKSKEIEYIELNN